MLELPAGTVTFLFSDIEGSTQLLKELGPRYADALAEHQRILRDAFAAHGGREVDTQGDSFFVAFGRAKDAVAAAADAQRDLAAHPWPGGTMLRVRMGLHTGEPRLGGERYVGLGVHRAARIAAAGHGGQVLLSRTTRDLVEDELPPGVTIRDLGERRLKDMDRPEHLSQLVLEGLQSDFARLKTLDEELRGKRRLMYGGSALIGVVAAAIAIPIFALGQSSGSGPSVNVAPNSLAVIDPGSNTVVGSVTVGILPSQIVAGARSIWVSNVGDRTVSRVDPGTLSPQHTVPLPATPTGLAFGEGSVWVASGTAGNLTRVDPSLDQPAAPLAVTDTRGGFGVVAAGGGSVWVVFADSQLYRIDPGGTRTQPGGVVGASPSAIVFGAGSVWVASAYDNTVEKVLPKTGTVVHTFTVGRHPSALAVGEGAVWVADQIDDAVTRIDLASGSESTISLSPGAGPSGIAVGSGAVWTANAGDGTVSRIDPARRSVAEVIPVGHRPSDIVVADDRVWVSVQAST
jgi:YVTN family beta-propeller protein